jgi:hypothetical protein
VNKIKKLIRSYSRRIGDVSERIGDVSETHQGVSKMYREVSERIETYRRLNPLVKINNVAYRIRTHTVSDVHPYRTCI